jgi:hypothetical protein
MILVGVENPRDAAADQIERALHTSGNVTIRKL